MAALSLVVVQAAETRQQSRNLRTESASLRAAMNANLAAAPERSRRAADALEAGRRLHGPLLAPSPWSDLAWRRDDDELHAALVLLP